MNYCLFHKNCADGFSAAWCVWKKYGSDEWRFIPVTYNECPPNMEEVGDVIIVDFSYPRTVLQSLKNSLAMHNGDLRVYDHHKTSEEDLKGLDYCWFDNNKSGAVLTWIHMFPGVEIPTLLLYVQDRDLWTFKLEHSKEINEGIQMLDKSGGYPDNQQKLIDNFKIFESWLYDIDTLEERGAAIINYKNKLINETIEHIEIIKFNNYNVGMINNSVGALISDLGNTALNNNPLDMVCIYAINIEKQVVNCSLRGHNREGVDCGIIAKQWNGGGHLNAAGFKIGIKEFFELCKQ